MELYLPITKSISLLASKGPVLNPVQSPILALITPILHNGEAVPALLKADASTCNPLSFSLVYPMTIHFHVSLFSWMIDKFFSAGLQICCNCHSTQQPPKTDK